MKMDDVRALPQKTSASITASNHHEHVRKRLVKNFSLRALRAFVVNHIFRGDAKTMFNHQTLAVL
jgi:hypothetical protein